MSTEFEIIDDPSATLELLKSLQDFRISRDEEELSKKDWIELEKSYYKHLQWRFSYPQKIFKHQRNTGNVISFVVATLILGGLAFALIQLTYAIEMDQLSSLPTEVSVETAGSITINSSIVGGVVLIISLVFFYLYLKNVFPIKHPTPPHVGFEETDLSDEAKARLFFNFFKSEGKNKNDTTFQEFFDAWMHLKAKKFRDTD